MLFSTCSVLAGAKWLCSKLGHTLLWLFYQQEEGIAVVSVGMGTSNYFRQNELSL